VTLVVKVGGAPGNGLDGLLDEIARRPDRDLVLVHGGSEEVDRLGATLGRPSEYYTSPTGVVSRKSDPAHLEVLVLALPGAVQTRLVAALNGRGVGAVGLSGVDGRLVLARRKDGARAVVDGRVVVVKDDRAGTIESVNADLLRLLLGRGLLPVVGPPAITAAGEVVNVDADRVAAAVAGALGAEALVLLTNVPGLLRDPHDPATLIPSVARDAIDSVLPFAAGRMRKKVLAARAALEGHVPRVVIAPSQGTTPIEDALAGAGTAFA
jgi:[amino group carrier protein]-L-2-aminoadipate 6-kinase